METTRHCKPQPNVRLIMDHLMHATLLQAVLLITPLTEDELLTSRSGKGAGSEKSNEVRITLRLSKLGNQFLCVVKCADNIVDGQFDLSTTSHYDSRVMQVRATLVALVFRERLLCRR